MYGGYRLFYFKFNASFCQTGILSFEWDVRNHSADSSVRVDKMINCQEVANVARVCHRVWPPRHLQSSLLTSPFSRPGRYIVLVGQCG